jgi:hypothetical protein
MSDKKCSRCGRSKPPTAYPRNASKAGGREAECLRCKRARENTPEAKEMKRDRELKRRYGIMAWQYDELVLEQRNKCAICSKHETKTNEFGEPRPLVVDHDHTSGYVRGLLCCACNKALGHFGDTEDLLHSAIYYLSGWGAA